ncbi:MAG: AraC family transcriptional regulator [Myxococcota bacterium]
MADSPSSTASGGGIRAGISALLGRAVLANLELLGIDPDRVSARARIDSARLSDPRARLTHAEFAAIFVEAERIAGDRTMSLQVAARAQTLAGGGVLGPLVLSSRDGQQALQYLEQYGQLLAGDLRIETRQLGGDLILRFVPADVGLELLSRMMESLLAAVVRAVELALGERPSPARVSFRHEPPPDIEPFRAHFDCDVQFSADHYELTLPLVALRRSTTGAHPRIVEQLEEMAKSELRMVSPRFTTSVREHVVVLFNRGERPTRARVAEAMKLSERTLQRRLSEDGTTFRRVSEEARKERAEVLLRDPSIRVADVAYAVGYDDVTSFTKAFRRWTGKSPTAFRESMIRTDV